MQIIFISTMASSPWGGSEELWSHAALRLREQGHQVAGSVVRWPSLSPKLSLLAERGVTVVQQAPAQARFHVRAWRKLIQNIGYEHPNFEWLKRQKPDLVVISQGQTLDGLAWMNHCRQTGRPYVVIVQANNEQWWPADNLSAEMADVYLAAQKVCCVSRHNLKLLEYQIGVSLPNATVVWNPFNVPADLPPNWPEAKDNWKLACVARLEPPSKGQDILLEVLSLPKWRDRPVILNLYGHGQCKENLRRLADRLNLKNVYFKGHVQDVSGIWAENQMLVLPSRYEGLPLTLVEAMWSARPAVVTDVGGNAEVCVDGETGFVAYAPTVKLLDEALERAWAQRAEWQLIGQAARRRIQQLVPKDPAGDFSKMLLALADKLQ